MTMFKSSQLVAFVKSMVGMAYWYGTCVYMCSESVLKSKTNQYPSHYGSNRTATYKKHIAARKVCMDCIGLIKGFFWTNGGQGVVEYTQGGDAFTNKYGSNGCPDKSANGMLTWLKSKGCKNGKIATLPDVPGILLFKSGHVGIYVGGGYAVQAQGFAYGVVKTQVSKRPWTEWAYLPSSMLDYDSTDVTAPSEPDTYTIGGTNEETIYNFLKQVMGFNTAGACGILANIYRESGFRTDCYGDSETSYGICQWHKGRFTNLKDWCAENNKDYTSLDGQLWFLKQELEKSYKGVLSYIQAVTNDAEGSYNAGYYWCKKFEIPADTENNSIKRGELARNTYYPKYTGGTAVVPFKLGDRTLYRTSPYMEGADVTDLQTRLNAIGFSCGTVDGKFGKNTESGVKGFQTACNLEVDGKFGKLSMAALKAYSAPQKEPETYTVQAGDTLWGISSKLLGAGARWTEIAELNGLTSTVINIGRVLKIPEM